MTARDDRFGSHADDEVIALIKAFIKNHPPPTNELSGDDILRIGFTPRTLYPVASEQDIANAEAAIGFTIPTLLRRLYREVSNGIEGFTYNLYGLDGGSKGSLGTLVDEYLVEYVGLHGDWKPGTLPFCDWGCGIYSCVDCTDPAAPVLNWEGGDDPVPAGHNLREFFQMWLRGSVR